MTTNLEMAAQYYSGEMNPGLREEYLKGLSRSKTDPESERWLYATQQEISGWSRVTEDGVAIADRPTILRHLALECMITLFLVAGVLACFETWDNWKFRLMFFVAPASVTITTRWIKFFQGISGSRSLIQFSYAAVIANIITSTVAILLIGIFVLKIVSTSFAFDAIAAALMPVFLGVVVVSDPYLTSDRGAFAGKHRGYAFLQLVMWIVRSAPVVLLSTMVVTSLLGIPTLPGIAVGLILAIGLVLQAECFNQIWKKYRMTLLGVTIGALRGMLYAGLITLVVHQCSESLSLRGIAVISSGAIAYLACVMGLRTPRDIVMTSGQSRKEWLLTAAFMAIFLLVDYAIVLAISFTLKLAIPTLTPTQIVVVVVVSTLIAMHSSVKLLKKFNHSPVLRVSSETELASTLFSRRLVANTH